MPLHEVLICCGATAFLGFWTGVRLTWRAWSRQNRQVRRIEWMQGLESE